MNEALAPTVPVQPTFAEGRLLAAFLDEATSLEIPEMLRALPSERAAVHEKLGRLDATDPTGPPFAAFRHVDEPEALGALGEAVLLLPAAALGNLFGFEWVAISTIIAGSYFAGPMPSSGQHPTVSSRIEEITNYCLFGNQLGPQDIVVNPGAGAFSIVCPEKILARPVPRLNVGLQSGFMVEFQLHRQISPITIMSVEDRAVALCHQERLVALLEGGVNEALCLVYYGYGTDILGFLPSLKTPFLDSGRVPLISDFLRNELMSRLTVQKPRRVITVVPLAIDV